MSDGSPDQSRRTGPAVEQAYQFLLWLLPTVEKFPRKYKFVLGDRIEVAAMDVMEGLIEATYTRRREGLLAKVNIAVERLRFLIRLAVDLKCLDFRRYEFAAKSLNDIGRQVGGWMKAHRAAQT